MNAPAAILALLPLLLCGACVKRVAVSAGADRAVAAGDRVRLGLPLELPQGARVAWELGDGERIEGAQIEHAWQRPGVYAVRIEIVDPDGERRADQALFTVTRPALSEAIPAEARVLLWLPRPAATGAGLAHAPLLVERLLAEGQEANAVLAGVREGLGFDPFSPEGWRTAGLDPAGDVAWIGLPAPGEPARAVGLLAVAVDAEPVLLAHLARALGGPAGARFQAHPAAGAVQELRALDDGRLLGLSAFARGYLWLAPAEDEGPAAQDALSVLRAMLDDGDPRLAGLPAWREASDRRPPGALCLWLREVVSPEEASSGDALPPALVAALGSLRVDLDLDPSELALDGWLALHGPEAGSLAAAARARNAPPSWEGDIPAGSHALLKLSLDAGRLSRLLAEWSGQAEAWHRAQSALDQLVAQTGIPLREGLLANLGDNYLLALRLRPEALWRLLARHGEGASLVELLEGRLLVQVRAADPLRDVLAALAARSGAMPAVRSLPAEADGAPRWSLALPGLGLSLVLRAGVLAVSFPAGFGAPAAGEAGRLHAGAGLAAQDRQVLAVDLERLRADLQTSGVAEEDASAAVVRSFIVGGLARLGVLGVALLDLQLAADGLHLRGGLRF